MAKKHGKTTTIYANGIPVHQYGTNITFGATGEAIDCTVYNSAAVRSFLPGLKDSQLTVEGYFDGATDAVDEEINPLVNTSPVIWTWWVDPDDATPVGYGFTGIETEYGIVSPVDGIVGISIASQSSSGRERLESVFNQQAVSSTATSSSIDSGASSANGGAAYLQVGLVSGGTPTLDVIVEDSPDDAVWATVATFTQVTTSFNAERVEIAGTIDRYLRVTYTVGGSTPSFNIGIGLHRA